MNDTECPNCDSENWHYVNGWRGGWQGGEPIEPDEGWCDDCDFQYHEHCKHPLREQLARFQEKPQ